MADDFDVIVVGAGMAGSAAAIRLAKGGANVLLLERGAEPGTKNLSGGILWGHDLDAILPKWWESMPVERHVVRKRFGFLTPDGAAGQGLAILEGAMGLGVVVFFFTFIPGYQSAIQARELRISWLYARSGVNPGSFAFVEWLQRSGNGAEGSDVWETWEEWFRLLAETLAIAP